jgi:GT2 family glycosyltransferase
MNLKPLVSIIIVNYNGKKFLKDCISSLTKTNYENFEIIIVDNGSSDNSTDFVKTNFPEVRLLELNKNYGFAAPNNMGAKISRGKYLVFLNNDTTVTPDWLNELVSALEKNKKITIGQSLLVLPNGQIDSSGDFIDELGRAYSLTDKPSETRNILSAKAACMIIRKDIFLDMGGFDESYFVSFEDVELGWRAWLWGYQVFVIPKSIVYHLGGQTIKDIPDMVAFHGIKNNLLLRLICFNNLESIKSLTWMALILILKKICKVSIKPHKNQKFCIPRLSIILKALFWVIKNQKLISKKRKNLKSRQVVSNKKLRELGLITPID